MAVFELHAGGRMETVTPHELQRALQDQDARLRADLSGVKWGEMFINSGAPGMGAQTFSTQGQPPQSPSNGYVWAIMTLGLELSVASQLRVYKGNPPFGGPGTVAPAGNGHLVTTLSSFITPSGQFSKGQFVLRAGDTFTAVMVTAGAILSIYAAYIEVPAEQQGKLWL
jgi:hypothetical protein